MTQPTNINFFIDIQNGFSRFDIPHEDGGCLYVPEGEKSAAKAKEILDASPDGIFVYTQDYHPADHISFMTNHPGVMEMRIRMFKDFLLKNEQPIPSDENELYIRCQEPVHFFNGFDKPPAEFPFDNILIGKDGRVIGVIGDEPKNDPEILLFPLENNRITGSRAIMGTPGDVVGGYLSQHLAEGATIQTLWKPHCIQNTVSAEFHPNFDIDLSECTTAKDVTSYKLEGKSGKEYYVLLKGMNPEVDSYGAGRENDRKSETDLSKIVTEIAQNLQRKGVTDINLNHGGLATNFCVEFSDADLHEIAVPIFAAHGIKANVRFIEDISFGIPINVPSGEWPDLANSANRMAARGTTAITSEQLISELIGKPHQVSDGNPTGQAKTTGVA